jgi:DNA-binding MarR family transcriptional regulator
MHRAGLIDRTPDPTDGRKVIVTLTEAGRRAFDHRSEEVSEHLARVLSEALEAGERTQLAAVVPLLERLADRL